MTSFEFSSTWSFRKGRSRSTRGHLCLCRKLNKNCALYFKTLFFSNSLQTAGSTYFCFNNESSIQKLMRIWIRDSIFGIKGQVVQWPLQFIELGIFFNKLEILNKFFISPVILKAQKGRSHFEDLKINYNFNNCSNDHTY